jgi:flagellar biosynthesis protein FlhA
VHIRDNLELKPSAYRITLKGVEVGTGEAMNGQFLAINPGMASGTLPGQATVDPAFGLPATWIDAGLRDEAQSMGYTVVDAGTVVATHLNHLITLHASELLGRMEVQALLDHLGKETPKLVEDLVPKVVSLSTLQKVLQNLLVEGVHIRDMRSIIEALSEHAGMTQDPAELTAVVRVSLGRAIVQQLFPGENELSVMATIGTPCSEMVRASSMVAGA